MDRVRAVNRWAEDHLVAFLLVCSVVLAVILTLGNDLAYAAPRAIAYTMSGGIGLYFWNRRRQS